MRVKESRLLAAMALLLALGHSAVCYANTITVTSLNDPSDIGYCTLHDAITAANSANNSVSTGVLAVMATTLSTST
jgi:hypothetical protein